MFALTLLSIAALLTAAQAKSCPRAIHLALGSYTKRAWIPNAAGEGVTLAVLRPPLLIKTAVLRPDLVGRNPSYLAAVGTHLYVANVDAPGTPNGAVTALVFTPRRPYVARSAAVSGGANANHIAALPRRARARKRVLMSADFAGSVTTFLLDGTRVSRADAYAIPPAFASRRPGPLLRFQNKPHPHMVLPYRDGAIVPDLGSDSVWRFRVDPWTGKLRVVDRARLRDGDGPRHAALHRSSGTIVVVNELSLSLALIRPGRCGKGLQSVCQRVRLVRSTNGMAFPEISASAVRLSADGRFVYAAVRRENLHGLIVVFRLDPWTGRVLRKVGEFSSGGIRPRDFDIIERVRVGNACKSFLAVTNRDSNNLKLFVRDVESGAIASTPSMTMGVRTPASVLPLGVATNKVRAKTPYFL